MKFSVASCLLATLISSILVIAIPIPVVPGQVVQRVQTPNERNSRTSKTGGATTSTTEHNQGVVLDAPNAKGHYQVAQVAAHLDKATYPHQAQASEYHPEFEAGHVINTGKPGTLHESEMEPSQKITTPMTGDKLAKLQSNIIDNCHKERVTGSNDPSCATRDTYVKRPKPRRFSSKKPGQ